MELGDILKRAIKKYPQSPPATSPESGIPFPGSPVEFLRPDVTNGPLKNSIAGNGSESLSNAIAQGLVRQGDNLHVISKAKSGDDLIYLGSEPVKDPGKPPSHNFYWLKEKQTVAVNNITRWMRFGQESELPDHARQAIEDFQTRKSGRK
jgi:hypothetical protein